MRIKKKVLFISHNASRTGAPLYLLNLIKFLSDNLPIEITVLLLDSGPLEAEFKALGKVIYLPSPPFPMSMSLKLLDRVFKIYNRKRKIILQSLTDYKFDLIYGNTASSCEILNKLLSKASTKSILHLHELQMMIELYCGELELKKTLLLATKVFAVSSLVENMLINNYYVGKDKITKLYVPLRNSSPSKKLKSSVTSFTIAGCGTLDWRKGPDIFIQIAKLVYLRDAESNITFNWYGGSLNDNNFKMLSHDLNKSNLKGKVNFFAEQSDVLEKFETSHVFLLTSREDAFPTVCLENANAGNPIICFKQATGFSEVINSENGLCADFLDLNSIVNEILFLSKNRKDYERKSENIKALVKDYSIEKVCQPILLEVSKILFQ